ncbi:MAG TPA: ABC transporter permease, partial [Longimicrobiales bacterium]|nr:ABC transporter permease [Longimicrobiales bacterium]
DPPSWRAVARQPEVLRDVAVWTVAESMHLVGDGEPLRLAAPRVSANLFRLLGVEPALGRSFTSEEETPGRDDAVILSHGLWTRAFGADPGVLGRPVELDGRSYRVVGVAPLGFDVPRNTDLWRVLALGSEWFTDEYRGWEFLGAVGHLADGVTAPEAARRLSETFARQAPDRAERFGQNHAVVPFRKTVLGSTGPALLLLMGAVGLVLLIACANVMNVLLARSEARTREFALRRALGSGAAPLGRLVLLETLLLALAGGAAGVALAAVAMRWAGTLEVDALNAFGPLRVDLPVLAFALLVSGGTALLFGLGPVARALTTAPQGSLREGGGRAHGSRGGRRVRSMLVVAEVALALVLMVAVGASLEAFRRLAGTDPGFRPEGVLTATLELPATGYQPVERAELYRDLLDRAKSIPGVESVGLVNGLPLAGTVWSASFGFMNPDPAQADMEPGANMRAVSPGYFATLGMRVLEGRGLTVGDGPGSPDGPVAVVDRTVARRFWPGRSPVGDRINLATLSRTPATVVGVVSDVLDQSLYEPDSGHVYFPVFQRPLRRMT